MAEQKPKFAAGRITEEELARHRSRVGRKYTGEGSFNEYVTKDGIRHFAEGIGDTNPLWVDEEYAKKTRYGVIPAMPGYLGTMSGPPRLIGLPGVLAFHAGTDLEFYKPLLLGDKIDSEREFADFDVKSSESGPTRVIEHWEARYTNQLGEMVAKSHTTTMRMEATRVAERTGGGGSKEEKKGPTLVVPHPWTDEERLQIENEMIAEKARGSEPRFWEDVNVGDEVTELVKGPARITDMACWLGATTSLLAYSMGLRLIHKVPGMAMLHPFSNAREFVEIVHVDHEAARIARMPTA